MSHVHELRIADAATPRELVEREWPDGVLSVYASIDVDRPDMLPVSVRGELRDALDGVADAFGDELRDQVRRLADEVEESVLPLIGEPPTHRSLAGFLDASGERDTEWILSDTPTITRVWFGEHPVVLPLIAAGVAGRPEGIIVSSSEQVVVGEWSRGAFEYLHEWRLEVDTSQWRAYEGPATGAVRAASTNQRDRFDRRMEEERRRFIDDEAAPAIRRLAAARTWEHAVCFGDEHLRDLLAEANGAAVGNGDAADFIDGGPAILVNQPGHLWVARAIDTLADARDRAALGEVELLTSGDIVNAAVGPSSCEFAAREGAVDRLYVSLDAEQQDLAHLPEYETIVRQVLIHGGEVIPVGGGAAALLDRHDGMAARRRY